MQVKLKLPQLQAQASLASTPMSPGAPGARSLTMLDMGEISIPLDILTNLTGIIDLLWLAHLSVALAPNKVEFDHHQLLGLQYEALTPTFRVLDQMSAGACSPYFRSKFQAPFWPQFSKRQSFSGVPTLLTMLSWMEPWRCVEHEKACVLLHQSNLRIFFLQIQLRRWHLLDYWDPLGVRKYTRTSLARFHQT